MPDWTNRDPAWIHLAWAVLAALTVWIILELRGRDALARFVSPLMQARLVVRASAARTVVRLGLTAVALGACVWALMRPQTKGQDQAVMASSFSADVMIVLDVSKSMLAEDVKPNRLERAKFEIAKMVKELPGVSKSIRRWPLIISIRSLAKLTAFEAAPVFPVWQNKPRQLCRLSNVSNS